MTSESTASAHGGLLDAFWAYERALMADDLAVLDALFAVGPATLRGDPAGLLVGHEEIAAFRRSRGGAAPRDIVDVHVRSIDEDHALVVAVTAPHRGGHGLQTQVWERSTSGWVVTAAHVSPPPATFDASVWRLVGDPLVPPLEPGPLNGETVAVKDLFAVAGFAVGAGVPQYLAQRPAEAEHAIAVRRLLLAGASVRGIARTDQFAYSLDGDNPHYGMPVNAVVPAALPGGSSSGSATAVALAAATIGLATDTAGSIRIPASYQGLWGLRTTHGAVPSDGLLPLAADFDTTGLLTRSPELLARAAEALLERDGTAPTPVFSTLSWTDVQPRLQLDEWHEAFRQHQAFQAWQQHGVWISAHPDALVGSVRDRFRAAADITSDDDRQAVQVLARVRRQLEDLLGDRVLVMPSASAPAPRVWRQAAELDAMRRANVRMTCLAAITGRPVLAAPLTHSPDGPIGVSYLGPPDSELALIAAHLGEVTA